MARPARHKIELSDEERSELERIARAEKLPWREVQRAKIVLYSAVGESDVDIAARLDTSAGIVGTWRRRFCAERLDGLKDRPRAGRPRRFPPEQVAEVKAIACELPAVHGLPLGHFRRTELHRLVIERGLTAASASTIWRWLPMTRSAPGSSALAVHARPRLPAKAARVLDLYQRRFEGSDDARRVRDLGR